MKLRHLPAFTRAYAKAVRTARAEGEACATDQCQRLRNLHGRLTKRAEAARLRAIRASNDLCTVFNDIYNSLR